MRRTRWLCILMLLPIAALADIKTLTSDSLPYYVPSTMDGDTIRFTGDVSSTTHGIYTHTGVDSLVVQLQGNTLTFGTSGADNCIGMCLARRLFNAVSLGRYTIENYRRGFVATPEHSGAVDTIYALLYMSASTDSSADCKVAIYNASTGAYVGASSEVTIYGGQDGWVAFPVSGTLNITGSTEYRFSIWGEAYTAGSFYVCRHKDAGGSYQSISATYGAWPDPWGSGYATTSGYNLCMYAAYTPSGEGPTEYFGEQGARTDDTTWYYPQGIKIEGPGAIVWAGDSASNGNTCLALEGGWGVTITDVDMYIGGYNGKCIQGTGTRTLTGGSSSYTYYSGSKNGRIEIDGGTYTSGVWGYNSRCSYDGVVIHCASPDSFKTFYPAGTTDPEDRDTSGFTFKVHGVRVVNSPGQGIVFAEGKNHAYYDTVEVDARNYRYTYPTDSFCQGSSNAFCMMTSWSWPGADFHHNYLVAGTDYGGADGGFEIEGTTASCANPAKWHHNYINVHRGPEQHYTQLTAKGFKIRPFPWQTRADPNVGLHIYNNEIHVYAMNDWENEPSYGPTVSGFYIFSHLFDDVDSCVVIENNYIRAIVLDTTLRILPDDDPPIEIEANGFKVMGNETYNHFTIRNNRIESNDEFYRFGGFDGGGDYWDIGPDTCIAIDTADGPDYVHAIQVGSRDGNQNRCCNVIADCYWSPDTVWTLWQFTSGAGDKSSYIGRTIQVTVHDSTGSPLPGASVTVVNAYSQEVVEKTTNVSGRADSLVTIAWYSYDQGDSTGFGPMTVTAEYGEDEVSDTITVTPTNYEITLTLGESQAGEGQSAPRRRRLGRIQGGY